MVEEIRAMWYEALEELLQCPVCLEAVQGVKFQCINGHHLCKSCKLQLHMCPICKSGFIQTRNLAVEQISAKLNDIKLSLLHPYHLLNRRVLLNKVCVATQTENCLSSTSAACQTESITDAKIEAKLPVLKTEEKPAFILAPKVGRGIYPCRIGSCTAELPHGRIVGHLRYFHKDVFYEFIAQDTTFKEKWILEYSINRDYDFAFQIKGMGLFFLNVSITRAGDLLGYVQIVNCIAVSKQFTYTFEALGTNASYTGLVKSCRTRETRDRTNYLHVSSSIMRRIIDNKSCFRCNLTIKRKIDHAMTNGPQDGPAANIDVFEDTLNY